VEGGRDRVVTGVEEEMKASNDDKEQQDKNQLKPTDNYQSANHSLLISHFPRSNPPKLFCLSLARCLSPSKQ
jgi:hypothetical protein